MHLKYIFIEYIDFKSLEDIEEATIKENKNYNVMFSQYRYVNSKQELLDRSDKFISKVWAEAID